MKYLLPGGLRSIILAFFSTLGITTQASPLTLDWVSAGDNPAGGYYVSPYTAEIINTGQLITLYCIDFNHEVAPALEWQANVVSLSQANVPFLQYGNLPDTDSTWIKYEAAAWLISQLRQTTDAYQQAVFQYAAWDIFLDPGHTTAYDNSVGPGSPFASQVTTTYNDAFNAVSNGYTPNGWEVVTPDPNQSVDSTQEFLTPGGAFNPIAAPEPVSIALLGTVLLGFAAIARWRMRRRTARSSQC